MNTKAKFSVWKVHEFTESKQKECGGSNLQKWLRQCQHIEYTGNIMWQ